LNNFDHFIVPGIEVLIGLYLLALGSGVKFLKPAFMRGSFWCLLLSVIILLWGGTSLKLATIAPKYPAQILSERLRNEMHTPVQLDQNTRIDDVTSYENNVIYNMTLLSGTEDAKAMASSMRTELRQSACENTQYKDILKYASSIQLVFRDNAGTTLDSLTITPQDCTP